MSGNGLIRTGSWTGDWFEQQLIALLAVVLLAATLATPALQRAATDLEQRIDDAFSSSQTVEPGVVPDGLTAEEWADIQAQIAALQATPQVDPQITVEPVATPTLRLGRFAQASFATAGATFTFDDQTVRLGTVSVGGPIAAAAPEADVTADRVVYDRGIVEEWFVETERGIEQGWTIAEAPAGVSDELIIEVSVAADGLAPVPVSDDAVSFVDPTGNGAATYSGLLAWDADGVDLPASMTVVGDRIAITVDVAGAAYPITVDPTFTEEQQLAPVANPAFDRHGSAIDVDMNAVDGPIAVIATPGSDLFGGDTGAVTVLRRDLGGTWNVEAVLRSNPALGAGANFNGSDYGADVSVLGTQIAVGSPGVSFNGTDSGAVHIYEFVGASWQFAETLYQCDGLSVPCGQTIGQGGGNNYRFGEAIDFGEPGELWIGAPGNVNDQGIVYQYLDSVIDGYLYRSTLDVILPALSPGDRLGAAVDADVNGNVVAGAPGGNSGEGAVYWAVDPGGIVALDVDELTASGSTLAQAAIGETVAVDEDADGTHVFIAKGTNPSSQNSEVIWSAPAGNAPSADSEVIELSATDPGNAAPGPGAVDFDGSTFLIGTPRSAGAGSASVVSTATWDPVLDAVSFASVNAYTSPTDGDGTGLAVALAGTDALIGIPFHDGSDAFLTYADQGRLLVRPAADLDLSGGGSQQANFSSAASDFDGFGFAVAVDGNLMAVGAPAGASTTFSGGVVYVYIRGDAASPWLLQDMITPTNPSPTGQFGRAVDVAFGRIVVGAPNGGSNGTVHVFENAGGWSEVGGPITAATPTASRFGTSVAFGSDGDHVFIGAPDAILVGGGTGAVHESFNSGGWSPAARTVIGSTTAVDFGISIDAAVSSTNVHLVVGDPSDSAGGRFMGYTLDLPSVGTDAYVPVLDEVGPGYGLDVAVFADPASSGTAKVAVASTDRVEVFEDGPSGWAVDTTTVYDPADDIRSIALNASRVAILALNEVEIYNLAPTGTFSVPDDEFIPTNSGDAFEGDVAVDDGTTVAFGVPRNDLSGPDSGQLYTTNVPFPAPEVLGEPSVAIDRNWAAVGIPQDDVVYVLRHNGTAWVQTQQIDGPVGTSFGAAVDIRRRILVVGAPGDDTHGVDAGAAYHYRRTNATTFSALVGDGDFTDGATIDAGDRFGSSVALGTFPVVIGAPGDDVDGADGGAIHVYNGTDSNAALPTYNVTRRDGVAGSEFGASVGYADNGVFGGRLALVGAPGTATEAGAVYVLREATNWTNAALDSTATPTLLAGDRFGDDVAVAYTSFNRVVGIVGAPGTAEAYFLDLDSFLSDTTPDLNSQLEPDPDVTTIYGQAVALSGDTIAVLDASNFHVFTSNGGSINDSAIKVVADNVSYPTGGTVFSDIAIEGDLALAVDNSGWTDFSDLTPPNLSQQLVDGVASEATKLGAPFPADNDYFGYRVEIDGDTLMVGVRRGQREDGNFGEIHIYKWNGSDWVYDQEFLTPAAIQNREGWGEFISLSGNTMVAYVNATTPTLVWGSRPNASAPFAVDGFRTVTGGVGSIDTDGATVVLGRLGVGADIFTGGPAGWAVNAPQTISDASNGYGQAVEVDGDLLIISETPGPVGGSTDHGSVDVWTRPNASTAFTFDDTLTGDRTPGTFNDTFGASLDLDNGTLIVGANYDLSRSGQAYLFTCDSTNGCSGQVNLVSENISGGEFGTDVQVDGDLALISARQAGNGPFSGQSVLFERVGGTWYETTHVFDLPDPDSSDEAYRLGLTQGWVVMGAPDEDQFGAQAGSVYVWPVPPDNKIVPPGTTSSRKVADPNYNLQPWSVDIDGDTMIIGAPSNNNNSGGASIFVRNAADVWQFQQYVQPPFSTGANFGFDVAVAGDTAVLGGPFHNGANFGGISIWTRAGTTWSHDGVITANSGEGGQLGYSVDIDLDTIPGGDTIVAGAPAHPQTAGSASPGSPNGGAVAVYGNSLGSYTQVGFLERPSTLAAGDGAGWDVAIDGLDIVSGAFLSGELDIWEIPSGTRTATVDTGSGNIEYVAIGGGRVAGLDDSGDVFVYDTDGLLVGGVAYAAATPTRPTLAFDGTTIAIGDPRVTGQSGEVRLYTFDGVGWVADAVNPVITAADVSPGDNFGFAIALDGTDLAVVAREDDNSRGNNVGSAYVFEVTAPVAPDNPSLQFDLGLAAGQQATVPVTAGIAIADIDAELLEEAGEGTLAASPLGQTDLDDSPLDEVTLDDTEIPEAILNNPALRDLPLIDIQLDLPGGWSAILAGTIFENRPIQDITLGEVLAATSPVQSTVRALNLSDLDVNGTPLTALPLTALVLGDLELDELLPQQVICDAFAPAFPGATCGQIFSQVQNLSVTEASVQGLPLTALPLTALPLTALPLTALPLNSLQLGSLELEQSPLTALPLTALPLTALGLDSIPLTALPLTALPLTALPLTALGLDSTPLTALPLTALELEGIPLTALEVEGAPLTALPLTALPLTALFAGEEPLANLPLDGGADWCSTLADLDTGYDCTTGVTLASTTLADLAVRGVPLTALPLTALPLTALPLTALPLTALDIVDLPLTALPLTALPLTALPLTALPLTALPAGSLNIAGTTLADVPLTALDVQGSPLTALPLTALDVATLPLTALPLTALPLTALPLTALPLTALDLPSGTLANTPLTALDVLSSPLTALPLTALPLTALDCSLTDCENGTLGDALLDGALDPAAVTLEDLLPALGGISLGDLVPFFNTITAAELEAAIAAEALDLGDLPSYDGITLGDLPQRDPLVSQLVLGQIQAALGDVSLADIAAALGLTEAEMQPILGILELEDLETFGDITLGEALANGDQGLPIGLEDLGAFLGFLNLQQMLDVGEGTNSPNYGGETLGSVEGDAQLDLGSLTLVDLIGLAVPNYNTLTLGELLEELDNSGNLLGFVLADLLAGLVGLEDVAFGNVDFTEVEAGSLPENTVPDVMFRAGFQVSDTVNSQSIVVDVELPADATYVPGTATVNDGNGAVPLEPVIGPNTLQWTVFDVDAGEPHLIEFNVRPEVTIGATSLTGRGTVLGTDTTIPASTSVTVAEGIEPNDTPATATQVVDDTVYLTYISTETDLDVFEITLGERDRLAIQLSNLTADLDLVLYGVPNDTAVGAALTGTSDEAALSPITDPDGNSADTEIVDDFPRLDQDFPAEGLQLLDVSNASGEVDELIVTDALPAGTYYVQVHGANGARNRVPATLQIQTIEADTRPPCSSLTDILGGALPAATPGSLPVDLTGNTLFLVNEQRLEQLYGAAGRADVMNSLDALVLYLEANANLGLDPIVIPVEAYAGVQSAYAAWDDPVNSEDACDPEVANDVVSEIITNAVDPIRDQLSHIIVVGGDDVIPMARIQDVTTIANEYDYRNELVGDLNGANAGNVSSLSASFWESRYLSDDPYGEAAARSLGDRFLYVPDVALGRLVENPTEIASALDHFVTFQGELDMDTAAVLGYDFLTDATAEISDDLVAAGLTVDDDLADGIDSDDGLPWDRVDAEEVLIPPGGGDAADLISFNGHFDHYRALPASGDQVPGFEDNVETSAIFDALPTTVLEGTLLFSAGCHGGLSVSDIQIGMTNGDWAQAAAEADALWIGNTGFGYGDTETIAYTEKLLQLFTEEVTQPLLVGSATVPTTVGQAFTVAKNRFVAENAGFTVYDEKASMEATFYGLPIYRVDIPAQPAPAAPVNVPAPDATGTPALPVPVSPTNTPVITPRGTYWTNVDANGNEQIINSPGRPVQPQLTTDVSVVDPSDPTELDQVAHGGLVLDMSSTYQSGVDPVVASVIFDEASERPEPELGNEVFPARPLVINQSTTATGQRQTLSVATGQFRPGSLTQRLDSDIDVIVYYADPSETDFTAPRIGKVDRTIDANGLLTITLNTQDDAGDVDRVYILLAEDPGSGTVDWQGFDLSRVGTTDSWAGSFQLDTNTAGIEFLVQAKDEAGNVGYATDKAGNFSSDTEPEPEPPTPVDLSIDIDPANLDPGGSGWYTGSVNIDVTVDGTATATVDGVVSTVVDGDTITVIGDGIHTVEIESALGEQISTLIRIDTTGAPTFAASVPVAGGVYSPAVPSFYDFVCSDPSLESCDATVNGTPVSPGTPLPTTGGAYVLNVVATDALGNSATYVVNFSVSTPLDVDVDATNLSGTGSGWYDGPVEITATASSPIEYSIDGGAPVALPSGGSFTLSTSGQFLVAITTDAGESFSETIRIDSNGPPTVTPVTPVDGGSYAFDGGATYDFSCTDVSPTTCEASVGGTPISVGDPLPTVLGGYLLEITGTDSVGDTITESVSFTITNSLDVDIDDTNLAGNGSGWYTGPVDITVSAASAITYIVGAGAPTPLPSGGTFTVNAEGPTAVVITTAGGETFSTTIEIDATGAPTFTEGTPTSGASYSFDSGLVYAWTCTDTSLVSCDGTVGGIPVAVGDPLPTTAGLYVLEVTGTDIVGNSATFTVPFEITIPFEVAVDATNLAANGSGWYTGPVDITVTGSGSLSYTVDSGAAIPITSGDTITIPGDGIFDVAITDGTDTVDLTLEIDSNGPPTVTPVTPVDGGAYPFDGTATYAFSCTDISPTTCEAVLQGVGPVAVGDALPATPGSYVLEITGTDVVGDSVTVPVSFDITTSLDVDVDDTNLAGNGSGWYTGPVDITVSAASAITYQVGAGAPTPLPSGGTFTVNAEGATLVSITTAGGESFSTTIEIDATGAPTFTEGTPTTGATYPFDSGLVYAWTCTDTSLVSCDGTVGGVPVAVGDPLPTTAGLYVLEVIGTDIVGNSATFTVPFEIIIPFEVDVDQTNFDAGAGWYFGPVDITVSGSGTLSYTVDSGAAIPIMSGDTITIPGDGISDVAITDGTDTVDLTLSIDTTGAPTFTEGTPVDGAVIFSDAGLTYDWTCDDPSLVSCDGEVNGTPVAVGDPLPTTPGLYVLTVTGVDVFGNTLVSTVDFEVIAPLDVDVDDTNLATNGSGFYVGDVDVTVTGGAAISYVLDGGPVTPIADGGSFTITGEGSHTFEITTDAGESFSGSLEIDSLAPTVTEIAPIALTDYPTTSGLTYDWLCTDTNLATCEGVVNGVPVAIGDPFPTVAGGYTLTITATDLAGNDTSRNVYFTVSVFGAAEPRITLIEGPAVPVGDAVALDIVFGDADGPADVYQIDVDWGDNEDTPGVPATMCSAVSGSPTTGNPACSIVSPPSTGADDGLMQASYAYPDPGVYTVTVTITDSAGNVDTSLFEFAVVFDPDSNGRVAGAGWYWSGPEAYADEEPWGGPAFFGYRARYRNNNDTPSGRTKLHLLGEFFFKSTSYDYLIVNDTMAVAEGIGKLDGETGYRFRVQGIDNGRHDFFQISIWDEDTGEVIYDNGVLYDEGDLVLLGGIRVRE